MVKKRIIAIFSVYLVISLILASISFSQFYLYKNQIDITYRNTARIIGNVFNNFFYNFEGFQQQFVYPGSVPVLKINKLVERLVTDNGLAYLVLKDDDTVLFSYGDKIANGGRLEITDKSPFYFSEEKIIESTYILNNRSILIIGFKADEYADFDKKSDGGDFLSSSLEKIVTDFRNDTSRKIEDTEFLINDEKGGDYTFLINLGKIDLPASKYKEKVEGIIACIRDISVYKKMEKELFEQKKRGSR